MVHDLKLKNPCSHYVVDEILQVDPSDRRSLRLERPPSTTKPDRVVVKVNGFEVAPDNSIYGYKLVNDELAIPEGSNLALRYKKKVYFNKKLKNVNDLFQVSYYTDQSNCRRCHNLNIEDDFKFSRANGRPVYIDGQQKLLQDCEKWVYTVLGSNPFHEYIGTTIYLQIGNKIVDPTFLRLKLTEEITSTLDSYTQKQFQQAQIQELTDQELLSQVQAVNVEQNPTDPTAWKIRVTIQNRTYGSAEISQDIQVPGYQNLLDRKPWETPRLGTGGTLKEKDTNNAQITGQLSPVEYFRQG